MLAINKKYTMPGFHNLTIQPDDRGMELSIYAEEMSHGSIRFSTPNEMTEFIRDLTKIVDDWKKDGLDGEQWKF